MKKEKSKKKSLESLIKILVFLLYNNRIVNFFKKTIYQGNLKKICIPGLNCYSCPASTFSCPIGAYQAAAYSKSGFKISYYVLGFLIFFGVLFGRLVCGFLCPFGLFQEILFKIKTKKISTKNLKFLTYIKYIILILIFIIPFILIKNNTLYPFFCKYICPQGILEGAIPISIMDSNIRKAFKTLFALKFTILIFIVLLSIFIFRPFCKWICPLGAFYSLFNKVSFYQYHVDKNKCILCKKCISICQMDVNILDNTNLHECIRCRKCINICPVNAINDKFDFKKE